MRSFSGPSSASSAVDMRAAVGMGNGVALWNMRGMVDSASSMASLGIAGSEAGCATAIAGMTRAQTNATNVPDLLWGGAWFKMNSGLNGMARTGADRRAH